MILLVELGLQSAVVFGFPDDLNDLTALFAQYFSDLLVGFVIAREAHSVRNGRGVVDGHYRELGNACTGIFERNIGRLGVRITPRSEDVVLDVESQERLRDRDESGYSVLGHTIDPLRVPLPSTLPSLQRRLSSDRRFCYELYERSRHGRFSL